MLDQCKNNCSFCFKHFTDVMSVDNLFRGISASRVAEIVQNVHHQVRTYSKGDLIINEGDVYNSLILIIEGVVNSEMMSPEGQVLHIEQLHAPSTMAPAFLFATEPNIPVTLVAEVESKAILFSKESLSQLFAIEAQVMHNFLKIVSNRVLFLTNKVKMLQFQTLKAKVASYLLQLHKIQNSQHLKLNKTQQQLADMLGVARPSVGRIFREMHNDGLILAKGKNVELVNIEKLAKCVQ